MTQADAAHYGDRHVTRRCDICGTVIRADCYPRTYENQMTARKETSRQLAQHIEAHGKAEMIEYLQRIHQVG